MKNKHWRFTYLFGLLIAVFLLAACGNNIKADEKYEGKYISVAGETLGMTITGEDVSGFDLELKSKGKGTISIDGDSEAITWTNDDKNITIKLSGTEIVGTIGKDTITFDNVLDTGMKLICAKEGTEAANPENYMSEADKNMIGVWESTVIADVLKDPIDGFSGNEFKMEFFPDYTVKISFMGNDLGTHEWYILSDWGSLDSNDLNIYWDILEDGIEVNYDAADEFYIIECTKQS